MSACVCDYGDAPAVYHREERTARKPHRCYECQGTIQPGERYERTAPVPIKVGGYWDGRWNVFGASWEPTHWMPLPAPPAALSQQKGGA
jgi:uncharacterized protein with PIN domain